MDTEKKSQFLEVQVEKPIITARDIEYKKVDPERFLEKGYDAREISLEYDTYIGEAFKKSLNYDSTDTTVINVGVGNGKTTVGYELMKQYAQKGYLVIVASPFIQLTKKDYAALCTDNDGLKILTYEDIDQQLIGEQVASDIHVITINSLLGNPGESDEQLNLKQSELKKKYLDALQQHCTENNKKVVIFFDEIHAGVKNFKKKYIHNLGRWKKHIAKVFVLSATYTEASNVVLCHLADLTDKKIVVYNCPRKKFPNQAKLHLCIATKKYHSKDLGQLTYLQTIIEEALSKGKSVNMLVATKTLTEALTNPNSDEPISQYLASLDINVLTSESKNKFIPGKINIGTTFSTGVSIDDPNSVFIIVAPVYSGPDPHSLSSIFIDGTPSIVQAVARLRKAGDIYIFMHKPSTLIGGAYLNGMGEQIKPKFTSPYISSNNQFQLVEKEYSAIEVSNDFISSYSSMDRMYLYQDTFDGFILEKSQLHLASKHEIFGKEVNPYIIWAAYHDQFANCTLDSISVISYPKKKQMLSKEGLQTEITGLLSKNIADKVRELPDSKALELMINDIKIPHDTPFSFSENEIYINGKLVRNEHLKYHSAINRILINKLAEIRGFEQDYDASAYILYNIKLAQTAKAIEQDSTYNNVLSAYKTLGIIRDKMASKLTPGCYIEDIPLEIEDATALPLALKQIRDYDFFIRYKTYSFMRSVRFTVSSDEKKPKVTFIKQGKDDTALKKSLLRALVDNFIESDPCTIKRNGKTQRVRLFKGMKPLPDIGLKITLN